MKPWSDYARTGSIWLMRVAVVILAFAVFQQFWASREDAGLSGNCLIECGGAAGTFAIGNQLCLSEPDGTGRTCFRLDEIIMVKTYNKRSVVYNYQGKGAYVRENLSAIERAIKDTSPGYFYLYRSNRQEIVNLRYTRTFNTCNRLLRLEEDFESTVARDKVRKVEQLVHRTCSVIGR
jgi:DNA-binding LytR/AlgR family response regulator